MEGIQRDAEPPVRPSRSFSSLPPEVRDLIWEATLPPRRFFQVNDIGRFSHNPTPGAALGAVPIFTLHVYHSPPSATQVCRESRSVALRRGFFLESQRHAEDKDAAVDPGVWFNPDRDVLYFDCNLRYYLRVRDGRPVYDVPGWDRVLHVGVEWRAFFRDVPRFSENQDMRPSWRAVFGLLYLYMPHMRTLNYIIPATGRVGEPTWTRERQDAAQAEAELVPLPDDARIPWETRLNPGGVGGPTPIAPQTSASTTYLTTWNEVRKNMYNAFEPEDGQPFQGNSHARNGLGAAPREDLRILGWWLARRPPRMERSSLLGDW
ncbi:hypothetical protein HJFPF1_04553 [Paramyrothecium foliicola]|nr:hypothetical protein HJFPF1_04553 [Paramyrothecium foliicola]